MLLVLPASSSSQTDILAMLPWISLNFFLNTSQSAGIDKTEFPRLLIDTSFETMQEKLNKYELCDNKNARGHFTSNNMGHNIPEQLLLRYSVNTVFAGCKSSKSEYRGLGKIQRNRCISPFSTAGWDSNSDLATLGCVNPPTVNPDFLIWKFASPETTHTFQVNACVNHIHIQIINNDARTNSVKGVVLMQY